MKTSASLPLALIVACATPPPPPPPPPPAPPPPAALAQKIEFRRLFGGRSSSSIYDPRIMGDKMMERVLLEPAALVDDDADKGIEGWTRRKLLAGLGQRGSLIVAPPPPSCDAPSCYAAKPTAAIRNLRFVSGRDALDARVWREKDGKLWVGLRYGPKDESICPPSFALKVRVVQLAAQIQVLPEGAIAAVLHEIAVVEPPAESEVQLVLPDPADDPEAFCKSLAAAYEATPGLVADDARFEEAAREVLRVALTPLYPPPPEEPAPKKPKGG